MSGFLSFRFDFHPGFAAIGPHRWIFLGQGQTDAADGREVVEESLKDSSRHMFQ